MKRQLIRGRCVCDETRRCAAEHLSQGLSAPSPTRGAGSLPSRIVQHSIAGYDEPRTMPDAPGPNPAKAGDGAVREAAGQSAAADPVSATASPPAPLDNTGSYIAEVKYLDL